MRAFVCLVSIAANPLSRRQPSRLSSLPGPPNRPKRAGWDPSQRRNGNREWGRSVFSSEKQGICPRLEIPRHPLIPEWPASSPLSLKPQCAGHGRMNTLLQIVHFPPIRTIGETETSQPWAIRAGRSNFPQLHTAALRHQSMTESSAPRLLLIWLPW